MISASSVALCVALPFFSDLDQYGARFVARAIVHDTRPAVWWYRVPTTLPRVADVSGTRYLLSDHRHAASMHSASASRSAGRGARRTHLMTEEYKGVGSQGSTVALSEENPGAVQEASIPDYVMLDFADAFFPDEAANSRLRKPHAAPELFG